MTEKYFDLQAEMREMVAQQGGLVNAHAHLDRAFTLDAANLPLAGNRLQDKWHLVNQLKAGSTIDQIYDRMCFAVERLAAQGVVVIGSFIDADPIVRDKSIQAAARVRTEFQGDVTMVYANQTPCGVLDPVARQWFEEGVDFVDIIGGLPARDKIEKEPLKGEAASLDVILGTARSMNKMAHVHVDQNNLVDERESELLALKTLEHRMDGNVVAVHQISLAAKPRQYREYIYSLMAECGMMSIACPSAWIDSRRSEQRMVRHNSVTPFDELAPRGIITAIGTDNISDIYLPMNNGDMWAEISLLAKACHHFDNMDQIKQLVEAATTNGRLVLGLPIFHQNGRVRGDVKQLSATI